jgi:hypothetical protein
MHFRSDEQFLKLTKILEIKNKGNFRVLQEFEYEMIIWITGPQSTNPKYLKNAKSEHLIG